MNKRKPKRPNLHFQLDEVLDYVFIESILVFLFHGNNNSIPSRHEIAYNVISEMADKLRGFYVEYEGENSLCLGRVIVMAENEADAVRRTAEHLDSPKPLRFRPNLPPEVTEVDIIRPRMIFNDPGL